MLTALRVVRRGSSGGVRRLAWALVSSLVLGPRVAQAQRVQPDTLEADTAFQADSAQWQADSARRDSVLGMMGGEMRRLLQMHWTIPEYHDEQRFVIAGNTYGPVVNIFASPYLGDFRYAWQIQEQGVDGMLVAVVVVDARRGSSLPQEYQNLNLRPGVNCLWLSYRPGPVPLPGLPGLPGIWEGSISPAAMPDTVCRTNPSQSPSQPQSALRVVRTTNPRFALADYPPVAFFSDATNGQPLLGVTCLDGFCEFGPNKGAWKPTAAPATGTREEQIKGWYDEQLLDEKDATGVLRPTVRGTIVPRPNLDSLSSTAFERDSIQVATIKIPVQVPTTSKYYRLGLRQGSNAVWLRKSGPTWRGRVIPQIGGPQPGGPASTWRRVGTMEHVDAPVPGTVRWRWTGADARIWSACGTECCRI